MLTGVRLSDEKLYACELDLGLSTHNDPIVSVVRLIVTGMKMQIEPISEQLPGLLSLLLIVF